MAGRREPCVNKHVDMVGHDDVCEGFPDAALVANGDGFSYHICDRLVAKVETFAGVVQPVFCLDKDLALKRTPRVALKVCLFVQRGLQVQFQAWRGRVP